MIRFPSFQSQIQQLAHCDVHDYAKEKDSQQMLQGIQTDCKVSSLQTKVQFLQASNRLYMMENVILRKRLQQLECSKRLVKREGLESLLDQYAITLSKTVNGEDSSKPTFSSLRKVLVDFRVCFTDYLVLEAGQKQAERLNILYDSVCKKKNQLQEKLKKKILEERRVHDNTRENPLSRQFGRDKPKNRPQKPSKSDFFSHTQPSHNPPKQCQKGIPPSKYQQYRYQQKYNNNKFHKVESWQYQKRGESPGVNIEERRALSPQNVHSTAYWLHQQ